MKYVLYKTDGTHEIIERSKPLEYNEESRLVGGRIEFSENFEGNKGSSLLCNEEGMVNNLKPNPFFTPLYQEHFYGDIVEGKMDDEGEFVGFSDDELEIRTPKAISKKLFEKDKVFTFIGIGDFMAQTTKLQLKSTGDEYQGLPVFKDAKKGARKKFTIRKVTNTETLIFEGNTPFGTDADIVTVDEATGFTSRSFRGNALINLSGDPDTIRTWVKEKNLNPFFTAYDRINHVAQNGKETLLFLNRFASCKMVADRQQQQLRELGADVEVGVGFQISGNNGK